MPPDATEPTVDLVLSAEVARTGVRRVPAATVRIGKRVVTETRTITVQVGREEIYVEQTAAPNPTPAYDLGEDTGRGVLAPGGGSPEPVLVLVLHEEVPEVATRVVATERVKFFVDRVDGTETVNTDLRHEKVALTEEHPRG